MIGEQHAGHLGCASEGGDGSALPVVDATLGQVLGRSDRVAVVGAEEALPPLHLDVSVSELGGVEAA